MNKTIKKTTTAIALSLTMALGVSTNAMAEYEQPKSGWDKTFEVISMGITIYETVSTVSSIYCFAVGCDSKS